VSNAANVAPLQIWPITAWTSRAISLDAIVNAFLGRHRSSSSKISICRPRIPLLALRFLTAISTPLKAEIPNEFSMAKILTYDLKFFKLTPGKKNLVSEGH